MHHHLRLTKEAWLDLQWWLDFLPHWSGKSLILNTHWTSIATMHLFTDASGKESWGASWSSLWLQAHWSPNQESMDITWKELYAIVVAVHTWGSSWQCLKILSHCDNKAAVDIWEKGLTQAPQTMALVRLLYFCAAYHNINVCIVHVPGVHNNLADSPISRWTDSESQLRMQTYGTAQLKLDTRF